MIFERVCVCEYVCVCEEVDIHQQNVTTHACSTLRGAVPSLIVTVVEQMT